MKKNLFLVQPCCLPSFSAFAAEHHAHWGYNGETGPENWGETDTGIRFAPVKSDPGQPDRFYQKLI